MYQSSFTKKIGFIKYHIVLVVSNTATASLQEMYGSVYNRIVIQEIFQWRVKIFYKIYYFLLWNALQIFF